MDRVRKSVSPSLGASIAANYLNLSSYDWPGTVVVIVVFALLLLQSVVVSRLPYFENQKYR